MDVNIYFEDPMEWAKRVTKKFAKKHPYPSYDDVRVRPQLETFQLLNFPEE